MPWLNPLLVIYALLNIGLGIDGYAAKGSVISLVAGCLIGLLMLGTVVLQKTKPRAARIASLVIAVLVIVQFLPKFIKEGKWLPAGVLVVASVVVVAALGAGHMMAQKSKA